MHQPLIFFFPYSAAFSGPTWPLFLPELCWTGQPIAYRNISRSFLCLFLNPPLLLVFYSVRQSAIKIIAFVEIKIPYVCHPKGMIIEK